MIRFLNKQPEVTSGKNHKYALSLTLAGLLTSSQLLISIIPSVLAKVTYRAHGRCLLSMNKEKVFDGHCTLKHKENDNGNQVVVVELDNGNEYKFRGKNLDSLRVEAWDGIHDVKYRENNNQESFVWNVATDTNRLAVKMDTQHKPDVSYNDPDEDVAGELIGAAIGGLIGSLISGGGSSSGSNNNSLEGMKKAKAAYETILVDKNSDLVIGLSQGEQIYIKCSDITRINGDKRVFAMDSAGKKGYILTNAVDGVTCDW